MKITHFVENLNRGGLERMVLELIKTQRREGHCCRIICLFEPGALAGELQDLGIPVQSCGKRRGLDIAALRRARQALREHASDVLHTHNTVAHYYAVLAALGLPHRRVVNTRHGMGSLRRWTQREWLFRLSLSRTDRVVAVCEAARRRAIKRKVVPADKVSVVPNGINLEEFLPATQAAHASLTDELGLPAHTRMVGTVGRLSWAKHQASLIQAFRHVLEQCPDSVLMVIGDGRLRDKLQRLINELDLRGRVLLLGDRGDVPELLQGLDLFVLSSLSEGYSMALLEACATGLPIVATDVGGNAEIVRDGVNGLLVPANDVQALSGAIQDLLHDREKAAGFGQAGRQWAQANASLETMSARYAAIYEPSTCA